MITASCHPNRSGTSQQTETLNLVKFSLDIISFGKFNEASQKPNVTESSLRQVLVETDRIHFSAVYAFDCAYEDNKKHTQEDVKQINKLPGTKDPQKSAPAAGGSSGGKNLPNPNIILGRHPLSYTTPPSAVTFHEHTSATPKSPSPSHYHRKADTRNGVSRQRWGETLRQEREIDERMKGVLGIAQLRLPSSQPLSFDPEPKRERYSDRKGGKRGQEKVAGVTPETSGMPGKLDIITTTTYHRRLPPFDHPAPTTTGHLVVVAVVEDTCGVEHVGLSVLQLEICVAFEVSCLVSSRCMGLCDYLRDMGKYMARTRLIKVGVMMTERVCLVSLSDGDWYLSRVSEDVCVYGPMTQSQFLGNLGINFRVEALLQNCKEGQAESLRTCTGGVSKNRTENRNHTKNRINRKAKTETETKPQKPQPQKDGEIRR
ncbi:hypothetical protein LXL04_026223 [Taraxacum kok-saghyz]